MIYYIIAVLALQAVAIIYLIIKVRQPVVIRRSRNPKDDMPDLGDIGEILMEIKPEIERNLKLNEDQKKVLDTWIRTIDITTKSKLSRWVLKKIGEWT